MKITYFNNTSEVLKAEVDAFLACWHDDTDVIEVHTSGSTGVPKQLFLKKAAMCHSAEMTGQFFDFKSGQTSLLALSPKYIAGMMQIVRALRYDLNLLVSTVSSRPLEGINIPIDFAALVPLQVETTLGDPNSKKTYELIKNVIIGGAPIHQDLAKSIMELDNCNYASFGMTETISHIALRDLSKADGAYIAMPHVQFSVNEAGCLIIEAEKLLDEKIVTNDCVDLLDDQHFKWLGRLDHVINSGGVKLHPEKMAEKLSGVFPHNRFYFTKGQDQRLGDLVVLVVEGRLSESEIKTKIEGRLDRYEYPKKIVVMNQFKETPTGKVIKTLGE